MYDLCWLLWQLYAPVWTEYVLPVLFDHFQSDWFAPESTIHRYIHANTCIYKNSVLWQQSELLSLDLHHPPCAISSCLFASPRAENRSSLILVSALRLFSRCRVFSCMADSADINTSVSFSFSLYLRSSCVCRQSNGSRREKWQWDFVK